MKMESKFGNHDTQDYQNDDDMNVRKLARLGRPLTELNEYISESWKIIDGCLNSSDMMSDKNDKIRIRN